jgi:hypothetical protein
MFVVLAVVLDRTGTGAVLVDDAAEDTVAAAVAEVAYDGKLKYVPTSAIVVNSPNIVTISECE